MDRIKRSPLCRKNIFFTCLEDKVKFRDLIRGNYGKDLLNNNADRIYQLCYQQELTVMNNKYTQEYIHKCTSVQHTKHLRSVINYIIMKQKRKCIVKELKDVRAFREPKCGTNHYMVREDM